MDPLSITASIIAVIGAAASTRKGISKLLSLCEASEELFALKNEVSDLQALFWSTKDLLQAQTSPLTQTHTESLIKIAEETRKKLLEITAIVDQDIINVNQYPHDGKLKISKYRWLKHQACLRRLKDEMRNVKSSFILGIAALTS